MFLTKLIVELDSAGPMQTAHAYSIIGLTKSISADDLPSTKHLLKVMFKKI